MANSPTLIDQHVELHEYLIAERAISAKLQAEVDQLTAQAATLRKAVFDLREIGKSFPAPATHECIEPTGECYDCLRIAFDKCADALAATPTQDLDDIKAPYEAQMAALKEALQDMSYSSGGARNRYCRCCQSRIGDAHVETCWVRAVLAATPTDSLEAYRHNVLEEVITAADEERKSKSRTSLENSGWLLFITLVRRMAGEE